MFISPLIVEHPNHHHQKMIDGCGDTERYAAAHNMSIQMVDFAGPVRRYVMGRR